MGSDAHLKKISFGSIWKRCFVRTSRRYILSSFFIAAFFTWNILKHLQPHVPSFQPDEPISYPLLFRDTLDKSQRRDQCNAFATKFHQCQENPKDGASLVLACHRKWYHSRGTCEPCGGLGSRMRCMLSLASMAHDRCLRVEFDHPQSALRTVANAIYHDPYGYIAEWLHMRSYQKELKRSRTDWDGNPNRWSGTRTYLHATPTAYLSDKTHYANGLGIFDYDPCLFHTLFQPSRSLHQDVEHHLTLMGSDKTIIGIHFRTGDGAAFGIPNKDIRTSKGSNLEEVLVQLMNCAKQHALQLSSVDNGDIVYFLTTDNEEVKKMAALRYPNTVYTTDIPLYSWLRADADYNAWLEIFLLSRTSGIVANERVQTHYYGHSDLVSTFPKLAAKIGFMADRQFMQCRVV